MTAVAVSGCAVMISSAASDLAADLSEAIQNSDDPDTVREGSPAYLLFLDGLVRKYPKNTSLMFSAAALNNVYADIFITDRSRAQNLSEKALRLATQGACLKLDFFCSARTMPYPEFEKGLRKIPKTHLNALFTLGSVWAGYIQSHRDDWDAVAEISRVEAMMQRVVEIEPAYKDGIAHVYLGVLSCLFPEALGGRPEIGKKHFNQAIALSGGKNLMAKVLFARHYARLVFDQQLHDTLLDEVINAKEDIPGYTLSNVIAKKWAEDLMQSGPDYF